MKKLNNNQMILVTGGTKCIYHVVSAGITLFMGPVSWAINGFSGNYRSVAECFHNSHAE